MHKPKKTWSKQQELRLAPDEDFLSWPVKFATP